MTRVKKTRSMKRIHSTKTGSKSKLKKQLGTDRQGKKDMRGKRVLSAYEKFLLENPEAKEQAKAEQLIQQKKAEEQRQKEKLAKEHAEVATKPKNTEPKAPKSLLEQLEDKRLDDLY